MTEPKRTVIMARVATRSKAGAFTNGKGWRKSIGKKLSADGRLLPARFWLGMDEQRASIAALQIECLWLQQGRSYWPPEALASAEAIRIGSTRTDAPQATAAALPIKGRAPLTVKLGIERYRAAMIGNPRLTRASKHSIQCRTRSLEQSPLASMPLDDVGAEQLTALVHHWLERPPAKRTDEPISAYSARMIVKQARACFDWLDAMNLWEAPRRFDRLFRLPRDGSNAPDVKTISIDDLAKLYGAADGRKRLLILLGMNLGFCSMECAMLKRSEIDFTKGVIRRARQKTNIITEWKLWEETSDLLRQHLAPANADDLALLTDGGKPLVWYSDGGHRVDVIPNLWARLVAKAEVAHSSFKLLRKTGATMIRSIGGIEVSEQYLSHSERSMARFYSRPDEQRLTDALAELRRRLQPLFVVKRSRKRMAAS